MSPLVSIMISCYNHEDYLDDCLQSLVEQTYDNIELLICDDKSPDRSYEKILSWKEQLEERFTRVVIYQNEVNMGATKSCNKLMRQCKGDYIKDMASDDVLVPDAIEKLVGYAETNRCDIIFGNAVIIDEKAHYPYKDISDYPHVYDKKPYSGRNLTSKLCEHCYICAPAVLIPARTIEKYGFYDDTYLFEDWEYWLRISVDGSIEYIDEVVVMYRIGQNSLSHYKTDKKSIERHRRFHEDKVKVIDKYSAYADESIYTSFYNSELDETIALYDKELAGKIAAYMKDKNYKLTASNRLKLVMLRIGLYRFLRERLKNR